MAPLIKLSKLSHWPEVEINSKQGALASQVMNIPQTLWSGGIDGEVADRASLMLMTLNVVENRKILSFFICMQICLLHKLTPEPQCQSSSKVEVGLLLRPLVHLTHSPHLGSGAVLDVILKSTLRVTTPPNLFTAAKLNSNQKQSKAPENCMFIPVTNNLSTNAWKLTRCPSPWSRGNAAEMQQRFHVSSRARNPIIYTVLLL